MRLKRMLFALTAVLSTCQSIHTKTTQKSSLGCDMAMYMLTNSIPNSCNAALDHITTSLLNSSQLADRGDICTSYCLTPLKQAALECHVIAELYDIIKLKCCSNSNGQMCFSLVGSTAVANLIAECGHYNHTALPTVGNCSRECTEAMGVATQSLDCCLHGLVTGQLLERSLWQWCGHKDGPGHPCSRCSEAFPLANGQTILAAVVVVAMTLA